MNHGDSIKESEWVKRKETQRLFLSAVAIDETNKLEQFVTAHEADFRTNSETVYWVYYHQVLGFTIKTKHRDWLPDTPEDHVLIHAITNCSDWEQVWLMAGDATLRFESLDAKERQEWLDNLKLL